MNHVLRYIAISLALLPVIGLTSGCTRAVNRAAERRVRDALPDVLGPARKYAVHVDNAPDRTLRGRLAHVTVDGDDVELANGLLLDRLHLDLHGVSVDTGRGQLKSIEKADFAATVGQASLNVFLAGESPPDTPIQHLSVLLQNNRRVTLKGERMTLGLGVPFEITGDLRLTGAQRVEIDPRHLQVVGVGIAGRPLQFLKSRFESAIDLSLLPFPVQVRDIQTAPGSLTLIGSADTARLLQRAQASHAPGKIAPGRKP